MKQFLVLVALACLQVQASPLDGPMVAFMCNKPAMYFRDGVWLPDENEDCLQTGQAILDFCKKVYPDKDIRNVMETRDEVTITDWCKAGQNKCHHSQHTVTPYKCMEGAFESEALLVPEHCIFDHIYGDKACKESPRWGQEAKTSCRRDRSPSMRLASYAILTPCEEEVGKFRGVEYVCCPLDTTDQVVEDEDDDDWSDEDEDEDDDVDDDYIDDDSSEEYDEEEDEDDLGIDTDLDLDLSVTGLNDEVIPEESVEEEMVGDLHEQYLHNVEAQGISEHEFFIKAKSDLQKHYHEKVTKMMKEWATARQRVQDVKDNDPKAADALNKDITNRFQRTYEALEQEGMAEKKQLVALHQQRVQAFLNDNKRQAFEKYLDLINEAQPDPSHILKVLKHYVRSEEKDRMHALNHFKHVRDMDPAEADRQRDQTLEHLKIIDDRIQQARQMLGRVPQYQKKIELQLDEFLKTFHEIDTGVDNVIRMKPLEDEEVEVEDDDILQQYKEAEQKQAKMEKASANAFPKEEERIDDEPQIIHVPLAKDIPGLAVSQFDNFADDDLSEQREDEHNLPEQHVAHVLQDQASVQQASYIKQEPVNSYKSSQAMPTGGALGIAVGGITVFVIIVVGIMVLRRRASTTRSSTGFVEVDQAASPEEKHVANMQINGYENPTYRYFEMSQPSQA